MGYLVSTADSHSAQGAIAFDKVVVQRRQRMRSTTITAIVTPTDRAIALREPVQTVLDGLKALTDERLFDPAIGQREYTIAANDFQRDLIFPGLVRTLATEGVDALFRFIPSGIPATELLRHARCQLIVTPFPPEGPDIYQSRLFDDQVVCFFDGGVRTAPASKEEFCAAEYIEVRFDDDETAMQVLHRTVGLDLKKPRLSVPNFSALPAFIEGSDLISAQLSLMGKVSLGGFASAPLPFEAGTVTMYMAWHRRDHLDPAHQWLRNRINLETAVGRPFGVGPAWCLAGHNEAE